MDCMNCIVWMHCTSQSYGTSSVRQPRNDRGRDGGSVRLRAGKAGRFKVTVLWPRAWSAGGNVASRREIAPAECWSWSRNWLCVYMVVLGEGEWRSGWVWVGMEDRFCFPLYFRYSGFQVQYGKSISSRNGMGCVSGRYWLP